MFVNIAYLAHNRSLLRDLLWVIHLYRQADLRALNRVKMSHHVLELLLMVTIVELCNRRYSRMFQFSPYEMFQFVPFRFLKIPGVGSPNWLEKFL